MSDLTIYNKEKIEVGKVVYPEDKLHANLSLIHQVVVAQMVNRREGNAKVKNRHEVAGSTRKIYRQKGTGGARHGDIKAPIFVGGGRAFGPKPKDYDVKLPQKVRKAALKEALLMRQLEKKFWIIDDLKFKKPRTSEAGKVFKKLEINSALVVIGADDQHADKSIRNLEKFKVCKIEALNVRDIVKYKGLVMTKSAFDAVIKSLY